MVFGLLMIGLLGLAAWVIGSDKKSARPGSGPNPTGPQLYPGAPGGSPYVLAPNGAWALRPDAAAVMLQQLGQFTPRAKPTAQGEYVSPVAELAMRDALQQQPANAAAQAASAAGLVVLVSRNLIAQGVGPSENRAMAVVQPGRETEYATGLAGSFVVLMYPGGAFAPANWPPALTQTAPGGAGPTSPALPPGGADVYAELPEPLQTQVRKLDRDGGDATKMMMLANELEKAGWSASAARLRQRAQAQRIEDVAQGRVIKLLSGYYPSYVAQWYTGDGSRWKELLSSNAGWSTYKDAKGYTQIKPWRVGQDIQLPRTWEAGKGPPPGLGLPTQTTATVRQTQQQQQQAPAPYAAPAPAYLPNLYTPGQTMTNRLDTSPEDQINAMGPEALPEEY